MSGNQQTIEIKIMEVFSLNAEIPGFEWNDYIRNLVSDELWNRLTKEEKPLIYVDFPEYYESVRLLFSSGS